METPSRRRRRRGGMLLRAAGAVGGALAAPAAALAGAPAAAGAAAAGGPAAAGGAGFFASFDSGPVFRAPRSSVPMPRQKELPGKNPRAESGWDPASSAWMASARSAKDGCAAGGDGAVNVGFRSDLSASRPDVVRSSDRRDPFAAGGRENPGPDDTGGRCFGGAGGPGPAGSAAATGTVALRRGPDPSQPPHMNTLMRSSMRQSRGPGPDFGTTRRPGVGRKGGGGAKRRAEKPVIFLEPASAGPTGADEIEPDYSTLERTVRAKLQYLSCQSPGGFLAEFWRMFEHGTLNVTELTREYEVYSRDERKPPVRVLRLTADDLPEDEARDADPLRALCASLRVLADEAANLHAVWEEVCESLTVKSLRRVAREAKKKFNRTGVCRTDAARAAAGLDDDGTAGCFGSRRRRQAAMHAGVNVAIQRTFLLALATCYAQLFFEFSCRLLLTPRHAVPKKVVSMLKGRRNFSEAAAEAAFFTLILGKRVAEKCGYQKTETKKSEVEKKVPFSRKDTRFFLGFQKRLAAMEGLMRKRAEKLEKNLPYVPGRSESSEAPLTPRLTSARSACVEEQRFDAFARKHQDQVSTRKCAVEEEVRVFFSEIAVAEVYSSPVDARRNEKYLDELAEYADIPR